MSGETERLTFATQGGEYSYHAMAARKAAQGDVNVIDLERFGEVLHASGEFNPGLGVVAIRTVAGVVEESAANLVSHRPDMLTPIVGRVDLDISLAIIGSREHKQTIEELDRRGVRCYIQKPAREQCEDYFKEHLPWIKFEGIGESTRGIRTALARKSPDYVAVGPSYAAEGMGGVIIGDERINPPGSVSSFYILERTGNPDVLPTDPDKTEVETILSLVYPNGDGEFEKTLDLAIEYGIPISRFIPFNIGKHRRQGKVPTELGGIFEVALEYHHPNLRQWIGHVNNLLSNAGKKETFSTYRLGAYPWRKTTSIELESTDPAEINPLVRIFAGSICTLRSGIVRVDDLVSYYTNPDNLQL